MACVVAAFITPAPGRAQTYLYCANGGGDNVSAYLIDPTTGALSPTPGRSFPTPGIAEGIAVDPSGRFAYVADANTNQVSAFFINGSTGDLIPMPTANYPAGASPHGIVVDASGKFVYVENWAGSTLSAYSIDEQTGALTVIGSPIPTGPAPAFNLTFDPAGRHLYVPDANNGGSGSVTTYSLDANSGGLNNIGSVSAGIGSDWIAIDSLSRFAYVSNGYGGTRISGFRIDSSTGLLSALPDSPYPSGGQAGRGLAIDPLGRFLFFADSTTRQVTVFRIDQTTGSLARVGTPYSGPDTTLIVDPTGQFLYAASVAAAGIYGYRIDQSTGALTPIPGSPFPAGVEPLYFAIATPTSSSALSVEFFTPTRGGNSGQVTMQIVGSGFQDGATVKLTGSGPDMVGTNTAVPNASVLTTTFNLTGAAPGARTVVVTNPDNGSANSSAAFTIEEGGTPDIWVDLVGRDQLRIGTEQTFYLQLGNRGGVDAAAVPIWLKVPTGVNVSVLANIDPPPDTSALPDSTAAIGRSIRQDTAVIAAASQNDVYEVPVSDGTLVGLLGVGAAANSSLSIPISLAVSSAISPFDVRVWTSPPWIADVSALYARDDPAATECIGALGEAIVSNFVGAKFDESTKKAFVDMWRQGLTIKMRQEILSRGFGQAIVSVSGEFLPALVEALKFVGVFVTKKELPVLAITTMQALADTATVSNKCYDLFEELNAKTEIKTPLHDVDPNDKVGPSGIGSLRFVNDKQLLGYSIYFDNEATANAPAQDVTVYDPLDIGHLNLNTVTLGPLGFGNTIITPSPVPLIANSFGTDIDLRPDTDLILRITGQIDSQTGMLKWHFQSLDPGTGQPTTDPSKGFLPPGAEANVSFSVQSQSSLTTGTVVSNKATVAFENATLNTPVWSNTLDNTPPNSQPGRLEPIQSTSCFAVQWTGSDVGAGVRNFSVFASDNGGPYAPWLTNTTATSATYIGQPGHTYSFYSQATDLVGNVEPAKTSAEATTTVAPNASCSGRPTIAGSVTSKSSNGATEMLTLQLTNDGVGDAQNVSLNQIAFRTLAGTGDVTLAGPAVPLPLGSLAAGASTAITFTLTVPATVHEFSINETGTISDQTSNNYQFSIGQMVFP